MNTVDQLDILAFGAHPDDVEACAGGTISALSKQGKKIGIIDLTQGDNSETAAGNTRLSEAQESAKIMGVIVRENLNMPDRELVPTANNEDRIIEIIRKYRPNTVIVPHWHDRHRAHRDASILIERAIQSAKYHKIIPHILPHKISLVLYYMIHYEFEPSFIFDISSTQVTKMKALYCHKSQLFKKDSDGNYTKELLDPDFMEAWVARSRWLGYISGAKYGEAFATRRPLGLSSLEEVTNKFR